MTMGQKIREMRKQMGLSQEVLGEILHVSRQAITKWETDAGVPDVSNLSELSKLFGVPVDYFLGKNDNGIITQLDIDITDYRAQKEENVQIIRHYYSEEWQVKYLSYMHYPKNKLIRLGLLVGNIFSDFVFNANAAGELLYMVDNINNNYYLLFRDGMIFIAHITENKLEVKNISNVVIKKPTFFNNKKHFVYDDKMFSIYNVARAEKLDNKKNFKYQLLVGVGAIVLVVVVAILFCLLSAGYIL